MPNHASGVPVQGNPYRIRDIYGSALTEVWLVSAVATILIVRGYLYLTGYPQVGGGNLHIAHMLWGGLGMIVAFGMLIIFAHRIWKPVAALVGGAGFGMFIDELGKFITRDNDYFFRPTIALIYAVFIVLFMLSRYLESKRTPTAADHLYYAVEGLQWAAIGKLDRRRRDDALEQLDASGEASEFSDRVRQILLSAELIEQPQGSRLLALRDRWTGRYWEIVGHRWLERIVIGLFVLEGISVVVSIAIGIATDDFTIGNGLSFSEWGAVISAAVGGLLALWGVVRLLQRARVAALHAFAASILVSLFFGQFFAFASEQLLAVGNLLVELLILGVIRFALLAEKERASQEGDVEHAGRAASGVGRLVA